MPSGKQLTFDATGDEAEAVLAFMRRAIQEDTLRESEESDE